MQRILISFLLIFARRCLCDESKQELKYDQKAADLTKNLFNGYSHIARPCGNGSTDGCKPVEVTANMKILSITSVDDDKMHFNMHFLLRQEWTDSRLKHDGPNALTLDSNERENRIWTPDTFFLQEQGAKKPIAEQSNNQYILSPDGGVDYSTSLSITLACPMDLRQYPFDVQSCYFQLGSYAQPNDKLVYKWNEDRGIEIDPEARKNTPAFELGDVRKKKECTYRWVTGAYSCLKAEIQFKRQFGFADWMKNFLPSFVLVILSWLAFYLGTDSIGIRALIGAACLQVLLIHWSILAINLPHVAGYRAIDVWFIGCIFLVGLTILELILVIKTPAKRPAVSDVEMVYLDKIVEEQPPTAKTSRARLIGDAEPPNRPLSSRRASVVKPPRKYTRLVGGSTVSATKDTGITPMVPTSQYYEEPPAPPRKTGRLAKFRKLSRREKIDEIARLIFPVLFFLFNIAYWGYY